MRFPAPLVRGRLVRRYKRFLADVALETGEVIVAHCANPGAMLGVAPPDAEVWLSPSRNPARKLAWSWELVRIGTGLVGINTSWPNHLAEEAILTGAIPELADYAALTREVRYRRNSRIDLLLEAPARPTCYVEVKNVHLSRGDGLAEFPDCVTRRGAKHLLELADMVAAGHRAVMLYVVQREDCDRFRTAPEFDPAYHAGLKVALAAGVEALVYGCSVTTGGILVDRKLELLA
ncbi:MAG TPA: DNA/RNA nuclease SfsA [Aliidongia sp.]|uniref:DNA/RNA nuclease SfsA n=1 Tax=Aliidongia sp. TaxID=1914230 RepID=UPI002DDD26FC|nr:DNA/RNA nuclease SfsA [Aliidongia sp.]HEV2672993.1 DNA/RNA nuclease SfsA [Aliidongia sp.]